MLQISESASTEIKKVLDSEQGNGKNLIVTFQGVGWSGPNLGLALDESTENLEKMEANGIKAYADPNLLKFIANYGDINIDFVNHEFGQGGFMIRLSNAGECGSDKGGCSSCG